MRPSSNVIGEFKGQYEFLSNFYTEKPVKWRGRILPSSEHAYQSEKTRNHDYRLKICSAVNPADAKKLGNKNHMPANLYRPDWDEIKVEVMYKVLQAKFSDWELREMLLATDRAHLVEGNWWGDTFWGVCNGKGKNMLGKLLMKLRKELAKGK